MRYWYLFLPAAIYQVLVIVAALLHAAKRRDKPIQFTPPVSVLKPLHGIDPNTYDAFVSQMKQRYPDFEVLFGVREENDPAAIEVRRLQRAFPNTRVRLIIGGAPTPNGKVGVLLELARHARNPIWVVNDSDIKVDAEYLSRIVPPLSDPTIGLVTCPYRVKPHNVPAAWEAIGIAAGFIPSTLVAQLIGVREFGLGSTLAFRAEDLEKAGGFTAIAEYLADDYQLAKQIAGVGKRALLSTYTVETTLGDADWAGVWRHQLRWARTIRASKGGGYAGLPITQTGIWIAVACVCRLWPVAVLLGLLRLVAAALSGALVSRSGLAAAFCWLAPLWDLYAFALWIVSYAGKTVRWRDQLLEIDGRGRILQ